MNFYDDELAKFETIYNLAQNENIDELKKAIQETSHSSIIGIGSGGSYTVASLLCSLHEKYTGNISRPTTPLEMIYNPSLSSSSPAFIISAEGKNPDILETFERVRKYSSRTIYLLTNRSDCQLIKNSKESIDISTISFNLKDKDGFLATNSLLLNAILIARVYAELDKNTVKLPINFEDLSLKNYTMSSWLDESDGFAEEAVKRQTIIIIYSPWLKSVAVDLESKLSESSILHCQVTDLRSFAHGRHLWFAKRPDDCSVLALVDPALENVWKEMSKLIPENIPLATMLVKGETPTDLITGLIAEMRLISKFAKKLSIDLGRPNVPDFGRDLYYMDISKSISPPLSNIEHTVHTKLNAMGGHWPFIIKTNTLSRSVDIFKSSLEKQVFRAIVFDYDGTLCPSQKRDNVPPSIVLDKIIELINGEIVVAIVSGRGDSMKEKLREGLPEEIWSKVHLGLYNGGLITDCSINDIEPEQSSSESLFHALRVVNRLRTLGVPVEKVKKNLPYQISIRFKEGIDTERMWFVIADALLKVGLGNMLNHIVKSKHSIDILGNGVNKARPIAELIRKYNLLPEEILTIGDQGAWPGNDTALLDHKYSLSVDSPARRIDRGWKLAPSYKRNVDATLWYLNCIKVTNKSFYIKFTDD